MSLYIVQRSKGHGEILLDGPFEDRPAANSAYNYYLRFHEDNICGQEENHFEFLLGEQSYTIHLVELTS